MMSTARARHREERSGAAVSTWKRERPSRRRDSFALLGMTYRLALTILTHYRGPPPRWPGSSVLLQE